MSFDPEWVKANLQDMANLCDEMGLTATSKTIEDAISLLALELYHQNATHRPTDDRSNQ